MLTNAQCINATCKGKAGKGGSPLKMLKLADDGGLYLWVYADGRKYWRMRYWMQGKEKSLSLGVYPATSLKDARAKRDIERKRLTDKLDPSAERRAENHRRKVAAENSFKAVALEWIVKQRHRWSERHSEAVRRHLEADAFPSLGDRPISQIEAPELLSAMRVIEKRGAYDLAHRVLQVCGQVLRYGIATGRCHRDIARDLRGALTPHKGKHQAAVEPGELPVLLRAISGYEEIGDRQTRLALELLALTFVRTNELIGAEWREFDLDAGIWTVPAERMKMKVRHIVPLSKQATAILEELREMCGSSRFILPGRNPDKPISNNTMLFALYRLGYKGKMTGHGFRAIASSALNEMGFRSDAIERQLAHAESNKVRGAYTHQAEYMPERVKMMQTWADHLDAMRQGAKILPFKAA